MKQRIHFPGGRFVRAVALFLVAMALLLPAGAALAQNTDFRLNLQRDFGFGNGSSIRGLFTVDVVGTEPIQMVTYLLDNQVMAEVKQAPFHYQFDTGKYPEGWHEISAVVLTKDGRKVTTPTRRFQFVSAAEESSTMSKIILPLLGFTFLAMVIGMGMSVLSMRRRPKSTLPLGARRNYGISGGAVCPNCKRPFALHWWGMNLFTGKYDRCDFCGRTGIFKRASREELAAAEVAELKQAQPDQPIREKSEDEKLKEMLDDSRFTDSL
jgi:hypothetical protein